VFAATVRYTQGSQTRRQDSEQPTQALVQQPETPKLASSVQDQRNDTDLATSQYLHINFQMLPSPGTTISDPWSIPATKIFTDAAWTQHNNQESHPSRAGLGIYIQVESDQHCARLLISAISPPFTSALQEETFVCYLQQIWSTTFMSPSSQIVRS
jgi:hypothetical protein